MQLKYNIKTKALPAFLDRQVQKKKEIAFNTISLFLFYCLLA